MSDTKTDIDELIRLAEWARNNGFLIRDVKIGSVELKIADLRIAAREGLKQSAMERDPEFKALDGDVDDGTVG